MLSTRLLLFFTLLALVGCAEADSQGGSLTDKNTGTTTTRSGTMTSVTSCANVCKVGQTRCDGDTIFACAVDQTGCADWLEGVDCSAQGERCGMDPGARCVPVAAFCKDGVKSGDESDIDCGGSCTRCPEAKACEVAEDCQSAMCEAKVCKEKPEPKGCAIEGTMQCGATGIETCKGGVWVETTACAMGCMNLACVTTSACADGQTQCMGNTPQTCTAGAWVSAQSCPQGCDMGTCVQTVSCMAGEGRCLGPIVQRCNATGSAWTFDTLCQERCDQALCVGSCAPGEVRCNGNQRETCQSDGKSWMSTETCANGCNRDVCIDQGYTNSGLKEEHVGTRVVSGCWTLELGGEVTVPAGKTLEVFADCVKITDSGTLTLGAGAQATFHAKTIDIDGALANGDKVTLKASDALRFGGTVSQTKAVWLWADKLSIEAKSSYTGVSRVYALYGEMLKNDAASKATFTESVMPPFSINSSTHPTGFTWNWSGDNVYLAWDRPFPGVVGYYVHVGSSYPTPQNAQLTTQESISLPSSVFHDGQNVITVVSVNKANTLGVLLTSFEISLNTQPPLLASSSHPEQTAWIPTDDVFMTWRAPKDLLPGSWIGYAWKWSERGDDVVNLQSAMLNTEEQKLFPDQPQGEHHFHIVALDRLGRTTPMAGRYTARVGVEPVTSNIAGTITDATTQQPILNATLSLEHDVLTVGTGTAGDFTFGGNVYVRPGSPYNLRVSAPGYIAQTIPVEVKDATTLTRSVALMPKAAMSARYDFGVETQIKSSNLYDLRIEAGPHDHFVVTGGAMPLTLFSARHGIKAALPDVYGDAGWIGDEIWGSRIAARSYTIQKFAPFLKGQTTTPYTSADLDYVGSTILDIQTVVTQDTLASFMAVNYRYYSTHKAHLYLHAVDHNLTNDSRKLYQAHSNSTTTTPLENQAFVWNDVSKELVFFYNSDPRDYVSMQLSSQSYKSDGKTRVRSIKGYAGLSIAPGKPLHVVWDGTRYHMTVIAKNAQGFYRPHLVRFSATLEQEGPAIELGSNLDNETATVAFDGTHVILVFQGRIETRSPTDHALLYTQELPAFYADPHITLNPKTGRGVLSYTHNGYTMVRGIFAE